MKKVLKHLTILRVFSVNCIIGYLEYPANFFMEIVSEIVYVLMKFIYVYSIYRVGFLTNGVYEPSYLLLICGNYMILTGIFVGFLLMNFLDLSTEIKDGTLDFMLVKPISLQFSISFRRFQFAAAIPNIIIGGILFFLSLRNVGIVWYNVFLYVFIMLCAVILTYSIFLILQLSAFWVIKASALSNIFETIWDFNNMPMQIYPKKVATVFTYAVPLLIISNYPIMAIMGNLEYIRIIWMLLITVALFILCRILWNISIKRYSSASS